MRISVLGYGTVGRGVCELIEKSSGMELVSVLKLRKTESSVPIVSSIDDIVKDSAIDTVVECIGGTDVAFEFACKCINSGKSFVTSNKALVAAKGPELNDLARRNNVGFLFSAACGGAIPVLHNLHIARKTDRILSCGGIVNGTTNFILSGLSKERFSSYKEALHEAQNLGYAEADPSADVSGMDSLRKIMLMSAVAFDKFPAESALNEGIENIDLCPSRYIMGNCCVRLLAKTGLNKDGSVFAYVEPAIISKGSAWTSINENYNAAFYCGKNSGTITITGQGAGRYPTASAVLRDLTALCSNPADRMLSPECIRVNADNSQVFNRYIISDGKSSEIVGTVSVSDMHAEASKMRASGKKCFFAEIEEGLK